MNVTAVLILLVLVAIIFWLSQYWGKQGRVAALLSRKLLHVAGVGSLAVSPLFIYDFYMLAGIAAGFSLLLFFVVKKRFLVTDIYNRPSWGIALFPVSFLALWLYGGKDSTLSVGLPMLILTFADAGAAVAGSLLAKKKYNLSGDEKSILGSLVFAIVTCICLWIIPSFWQGITGQDDMAFNALTKLSTQEKWILYATISLFAATVEGATSGGWDNVTVPLSVAWLLAVIPGFEGVKMMLSLPVLLFFGLLGLMAYKKQWLDRGGTVTAALLGFVIWVGGGWTFVLFIGLFFLSGSILSKLQTGNQTGSDHKKGKPRDYMQVLCNGGVAGACIVWNGLTPTPAGLPVLLFAISVAICTADTWSSEIGTRFGGKVINIISFQELPAGVSGGISWMGTLAGLVGCIFMGVLAGVFHFGHIGWIMVGGFVGMLMDSILGSLWQVRYVVQGKRSDSPASAGANEPVGGLRWMTNDLVNLFSNLFVTLFLALIISNL